MTHKSFLKDNSTRMLRTGSLACVLFTSPLVSMGQFTKFHEFNQAGNVKMGYQYALEMLTPTTAVPTPVNEAVMAGTFLSALAVPIPGPVGVPTGTIHFVQTDGNADVVASVEYDHPDYDDERAVDIVADGAGSYYIVCSVRPDAGSSLTVKDRDKIKILKVDDQGTLLNEATLYDATALTPPQRYGRSLYPVHSIFHNGSLYICGYMCRDDTRNSTTLQPDFTHDKAMFVMRFDPLTWTVAAVEYFDWVPTLASLPLQRDYDIAMRMQVLQTGNWAGEIFVTGSLNAMTTTSPGYQVERSGTLSLIVDDVNVTLITANNFIETDNGDGYGPSEYGIGLQEDASTGNNYIIGAQFSPGSSIYWGFEIHNGNLAITRVDNTNFSWTSGFSGSPKSRLYRYGSYNPQGIISTAYTPFNSNGTRINIVGYVNQIAGGTYDYIPMAADVEVMYGPGNIAPDATNEGMRIYRTTQPSAWFNYAGGLSNRSWMANHIQRTSSATDVVIADNRATSSLALGIRFIIANSNGQTAWCISIPDPHPDYYTMELKVPNVSLTYPQNPSISQDNESTNSYAITTVTTDCDQDGGYYKNSNGSGNAENLLGTQTKIKRLTIFPNPANNELNIKGLSECQYIVTDITGRHLMNGNAKGDVSLDISALVPGIYILDITENGKSHKAKFIKE